MFMHNHENDCSCLLLIVIIVLLFCCCGCWGSIGGPCSCEKDGCTRC